MCEKLAEFKSIRKRKGSDLFISKLWPMAIQKE